MSNQKIAPKQDGIVAYLRVSTDEQAVSGLGLAAQRAAIEAEAEKRALPVLEWCEDPGVSGKTIKRPGLETALAHLKNRRGSMLMVSKLDRLSRSVHDASGLMLLSEKQKWGLVALDVQLDTSTPTGAAMTQLLAVFGELERRLIGQRTRDALAVKRAQGVKLGRPRVINDEVADRIRGNFEAGLSWSEIARRLTEEKVPTARGGATWYPASVRAIGLRDRAARP